jgi:DNA primase large subunit
MALETTHHLKYKSRLQYGLFLKGIGLSMEEAIRCGVNYYM